MFKVVDTATGRLVVVISTDTLLKAKRYANKHYYNRFNFVFAI